MTVLHVSTSGSDEADGSAEAPFRTINRAARAAGPGDTVLVRAGVYREWVNPPRGGTAEAPITFQAAVGPDGSFEPVTITGAEVVTGDLRDPASLRAALAGVDVVVSTASGTKRAPPDTTATVDAEGTANLAAAAAASGVRKLVLVSAAGVAGDAPPGVFRDKWHGEEAVRASGVPYVILRPARYMADWIGFLIGLQLQAGGGVVELVGDGTKPSSFVDEADVAEVAASLARDPRSGPAEVLELSAETATYPDVVERIARVTGAPLSVRYLPVGADVSTVPDALKGVVTRLLTIHAVAPAYAAVETEAADRYGVSLTTVDGFLARTLAPQPA